MAETRGASGPRSREAARAKLMARLLAVLDLGLSVPLRVSDEELGRGRLLVGTSVLLLLGDMLFLLFHAPTAPFPGAGLQGVVYGLCYLGALGSLRWGESTRPAALLLCTAFTLGVLITSALARTMAYGAHPVCMFVPLLTVYLLGPRLGLLFTLATCVDVAVVVPLTHPPEPGILAAHLYTAFFILGAWAISCLPIAARDHASRALEQALRTLREQERKLVSLLENTEDIVCSLDAELRLIAGNPAFVTFYRELFKAEPESGRPFLRPNAPEPMHQQWTAATTQVLVGQRVRFETLPEFFDPPRVLDLSLTPVFDSGRRVVGLTLFGRDISDRKNAEARLGQMHRSLMDVSRQAGMAEIATGVLHNVGNALNSVNVSVNLLAERLAQSRLPGLTRVSGMLREQAPRLASFLTEDPRGQHLPSYLEALARQLTEEREEIRHEVHTLQKSVEHIKSVVSMQQEHARFSGVEERLDVTELLNDALRLHATILERRGIGVRREYSREVMVHLDRHKLLQIILNLVTNAVHSLEESGRPDKWLTLRVESTSAERLRIAVADNGVGIAPEDAPRLFTQGFTTKKDGHGFGLHISALAAMEMNAVLSCSSGGRGQGATFIIDLPMSGEESRA